MTTNTLQNKKKKGKFQAIPSRSPADPVASAVAENIEILTGQRGHGGKKAVLWEDLEELKLAELSRSGKPRALIGVGGNNQGSNQGNDNGDQKQVIEAPTIPLHAEIKNGFGYATLTWDTPAYKGHAYTEIFQATEDDFTKAVRVEATAANIRTIPLSMSGKVLLLGSLCKLGWFCWSYPIDIWLAW